jgi:2-dehydropantoate 2-reductase
MSDNKIKKVGVVGLGPVGMIIAAHLVDAGCEVAICDLDKIKLNLIRKEGVRLEGVTNKHVYFNHVHGDISELEELDLDIVVVALKAHQLAGVVNEFANFKNKDLSIVCALNGIDVEKIASDIVGESRIIRMVINFAGNLNAPNVTKVTFITPPTYVASIDDSKTELAEDFAEWLNKVDLGVEVVDSFRLLKRVWSKTILNASLSALCGVGRMTMKEAMDNPDTVELVEQIIEEGVKVAEAEKIIFDDNFIRICLRYLKSAGHHFPSLAVDLLNNRPTEIDYLNGKIVDYGRKHLIRTSLNLSFTNMVKAMSHKNYTSVITSASKTINESQNTLNGSNEKSKEKSKGNHFLGIDLGSAFTKITVIDENQKVLFQTTVKTQNSDRVALKHVHEAILTEYNVKYSCATGYGRKHFTETDMIKTEINCAAIGVSKYIPGEKNIIDIGGEDIKIIKCDANNNVSNFHMNDKCAAGTGSFLSEIAERAEINIPEMSNFASLSAYDKELNSFCTVFAKTEIMNWIFDGLSKQDIARGIYISIANKVAKLRFESGMPTYMIGGVIAHHPYLKVLLNEKFDKDIQIIENPQHIVSYGAAIIAQQHYSNKKQEIDSKSPAKKSLTS